MAKLLDEFDLPEAPNDFMLFGLLGFAIFSFLTIFGKIDKSWGFAISLTFLIIIISSFVSMSPKELK